MNSETLKKLHEAEVEILDEINRICEKYNIQYFLIGGTLLGAVRHQGFIPWDDDLDIAMPRKEYEKFIEICINKHELREKFIIDCIKTNSNYYLPFIKLRNKNTIYEQKNQKFYKGPKGIWVDIFPLDNAKNETNESKKEKIVKNLKAVLYLKNFDYPNKNVGITKKIVIRIIKNFPNKFLNSLINKIMKFNNNEDYEYFVNFGSQYGLKKQTHLKKKYFPANKLVFEGKKYRVPNDYKYVLEKIYGKDYMKLPPEEKRITHNPLRIKFEDGEEYTFEQ